MFGARKTRPFRRNRAHPQRIVNDMFDISPGELAGVGALIK
jgi:hypothetical protein